MGAIRMASRRPPRWTVYVLALCSVIGVVQCSTVPRQRYDDWERALERAPATQADFERDRYRCHREGDVVKCLEAVGWRRRGAGQAAPAMLLTPSTPLVPSVERRACDWGMYFDSIERACLPIAR